MFHLITIGLGTSHLPGEKRRIPDGTPCYVFMQLLTPAVISTENGIRRVEVNDCILYQPRTPRILNAHDENAIMRNNWMFLEGDDVQPIMDQYNIRANRVYHPDTPNSLTELFVMMYSEKIRPEKEDSELESLIFRQMMIYLSRGIRMAANVQNAAYSRHYDEIATLHFNIYNDVTRPWTVEKIADELQLSATWLNILYRERYGLSLKQDIIKARIEYAKQLICYTDSPLRDVATLSGFQNEYYFSRVFKKVTSRTPGEYRKKHAKS